MKIGILTYHCVPNFGAQLQTLSTVCYLRNAGHEPVVLNWYPQDLEDMYKFRISSEQMVMQYDFAQKIFPISKLCRTEGELVAEILKLQLDAIVVGSDALFKYVPWKLRHYLRMGKYKPRVINKKVPSVEKLHNNPFFGGILNKISPSIPAIVYASSSQNCAYQIMTFLEKMIMGKALNNYQFISVRDEWTRDMVKSITHRQNVPIFPDPVFAFNQNVGNNIPSKDEIMGKYNLKAPYVLLSFWLDYCSDEYIASLAKSIEEKGLLPVGLAMPEGVTHVNIKKVITTPLSPIDWYALIKYSAGYIGERMHPIVVSLHNSVPCFSFDEYGVFPDPNMIYPKVKSQGKESSKIYHILHQAGFDKKNWYSYLYSNNDLPTPQYVVDTILSFDKKRCANFADSQLAIYNRGMETALEYLRNVHNIH